MANSHVILLLHIRLSFIYVLVYTSIKKLTPVANATKISLPLIHRYSSCSPFSKSKLSFPPDDIRGSLMPNESRTMFLVNVSIGEPPVPQLLGMDSGSGLIWVCTTCDPDLGPAFDPKKSSTYNNISCSSEHKCLDYYSQSYCELESSQCSYQASYASGTYSNGILATEKFTFQTSSEGIVQVPNVTFGTGLKTRWYSSEVSGLFGLKPDKPHSFTTVLGKKFSYCLGNINDPSYMHNQLILGDGAILEGPSTPMESREGHYVVNFNGISVGGEVLEIDAEEFGYNTVIDCGSTYTELSKGVYDQLRRKIMDLMDDLIEPVKIASNGPEQLCYWGNLVRDLKGFPVVTLHFMQGADLDLSVDALFYRRNDSIFCLAIVVAGDQFNIVGVHSQQYYNVGFDMNAMEVSFQYIDCSLLED